MSVGRAGSAGATRRRSRRVAVAVVIAVAAAPVGAQVRHLPAGTGLGEGRPQPGDSALPIPHAPPRLRPAREARPWSTRMAESVMRRNPQVHRRWDYTAGVVLGAIERVGLARRDSSMLAYVRINVDRWVRPDGSIDGYDPAEHNIDAVSPGRLLFGLDARTGDPRYRAAADRLRAQLRTQPRTADGGFWHKQIYPQQMWLDGLYMGEPFYAEYARRYAPPAERDSIYADVVRQFTLVATHTRDPRTNLMSHAWDAERRQPWADPTSGRSPNTWGRAMGWYVVGAVEVLDQLPARHPGRAAIIRTLRDAADGIAQVQDPATGLWWDVLDRPQRAGNYLEASASAMFAYALARAARLGYVDARYRGVAERGFGGIVANLVREQPDGSVSLVNVVQVSGLGGAPRRDGSTRDGSYAYYVSEPVVTDDYKGVGPFILAALELDR